MFPIPSHKKDMGLKIIFNRSRNKTLGVPLILSYAFRKKLARAQKIFSSSFRKKKYQEFPRFFLIHSEKKIVRVPEIISYSFRNKTPEASEILYYSFKGNKSSKAAGDYFLNIQTQNIRGP